MVHVMASLMTRQFRPWAKGRFKWSGRSPVKGPASSPATFIEKEEVVDAREFDCIDCNSHVYTWSDDTRERCAVCTWIHNLPDLTQAEIDEIRVLTATPILQKYRDDSFPERNCDYCGNLYKGPAVYCSHVCAMKDA